MYTRRYQNMGSWPLTILDANTPIHEPGMNSPNTRFICHHAMQDHGDTNGNRVYEHYNASQHGLCRRPSKISPHLVVPLVDLLASVRGHTLGGSGPSLAATLAVLGLEGTGRGSRGGGGGGRSSGSGGGSGLWASSGGRGEQVSGDAEPVENVPLLSGDVVRYSLSTDGLEQGTVGLPGPSAEWRVVVSLGGSAWVAEDVGPLLDTLGVVAVVEGGVAKRVAQWYQK
jgi:hypothetical protein